MTKGLLAAVTIAAIMISGAATAETTNAKIRSVDTETKQLVLKNGFRFSYGDDINAADLKEGSYAKVVYKKMKNGELVATKITVRASGD